MAQIIINNTTHIGSSVCVINGKVIIDGKDLTPDSKEISISVSGDIDSLTVDYCRNMQVI